MAWTTPRDWTSGEIITATILNTDQRDNLTVLSTHAHTNAAGQGSSTLGNLVKATFTDASAPSAPGSGLTVLYTVGGRPYYRAGSGGASTQLAILADVHAQTHASAHQPGGADAMAVDAGAGVGSLRTLGTTSTSAAAGNHSHTAVANIAGVSEEHSDSDSAAIPIITGDNSGAFSLGSSHTVVTKSISPTASARMWAGGFVVMQPVAVTSATLVAELLIDGNVVDSETLCSSESGTTVRTSALAGEYNVSSGSRIALIRVRLSVTGGGATANIDVAGGLGCGAMVGQ